MRRCHSWTFAHLAKFDGSPHEFRLCPFSHLSRRSRQGKGIERKMRLREGRRRGTTGYNSNASGDHRDPSFDSRVLNELTLNPKTWSCKVPSTAGPPAVQSAKDASL